MNPTLNRGVDPRPLELAWYRIHGKYPKERIGHDSSGRPYVIGDWSWNMKNPDKTEFIEDAMQFSLFANRE